MFKGDKNKNNCHIISKMFVVFRLSVSDDNEHRYYNQFGPIVTILRQTLLIVVCVAIFFVTVVNTTSLFTHSSSYQGLNS